MAEDRPMDPEPVMAYDLTGDEPRPFDTDAIDRVTAAVARMLPAVRAASAAFDSFLAVLPPAERRRVLRGLGLTPPPLPWSRARMARR